MISPNLAVPLTASIGKHLETLSVENVKIPASSHLFCKLKNLHVGFSRNRDIRSLTIHQLVPILDSSPRLETLSLRHIPPTVSPNDGRHSKPITHSHLSSLSLTALSLEAALILDRLNLPATTSITLDLEEFAPSHLPSSFHTKFSRTIYSMTPPRISHILLPRARSGWAVSN